MALNVFLHQPLSFFIENKITVAGKVKFDKEVREMFPVESEVRVRGGNSKKGLQKNYETLDFVSGVPNRIRTGVVGVKGLSYKYKHSNISMLIF